MSESTPNADLDAHNCRPAFPTGGMNTPLPRAGFTCPCGRKWVRCGDGYVPHEDSPEAIINIERMTERYQVICSRCGLVAVDLSAQEAYDEQRRHRCLPTT